MLLEVPELPRPGPGSLCLVRLPNILGIEARPFGELSAAEVDAYVAANVAAQLRAGKREA